MTARFADAAGEIVDDAEAAEGGSTRGAEISESAGAIEGDDTFGSSGLRHIPQPPAYQHLT
ncbi:MAG: hypothetical protein ABSA32_11200 [Candidatus Acidiferrales bacterium]